MDEWQPIKTAPKAGSMLLLFDHTIGTFTGFNQLGYVWFEGSAPCKFDTWFWASAASPTEHRILADEYDLAPTHWMPLPLPPSAIAKLRRD